MTELEKKCLLTKNEYAYLMERFGYNYPWTRKPIIKQINYYFDTDDLSMHRQNITCRIRLKDGKYTATMKQHSLNTDHSIETEMDVFDGIYNNAFTAMGLKLQGELITKRCMILKESNCEVMLDQNEYLGYTDYELEIEYAPDHEKDAQIMLKRLVNLMRHKHFLIRGLPNLQIQSTPSKSSRFFQRKSITNENKFFCNSMCMACLHFNSDTCKAPHGLCNYEEY